ncbi:MAG: hypothetical protein L6R43_08480 [Planctomycetes bacterium]|nr:hypothetical protein [Planctomycetota bacterium]
MIRTALDTSVVVAAVLRWHEDNDRSLDAIEAACGKGRGLLLPRTVLLQSWSVATRMPPGRRLSPRDAMDLLRALLAGRAEVPAAAGSPDWPLLEEAVSSGVVGGAIHDFEILDAAARAGAGRLLTLNPADFLRFGDRGVEIVAPQGRPGRAPRVGAATGGAPRPPPHPRVNLRYPPISSNPRRR